MNTSNHNTATLLGQKIAHYRIIRKIGQGGMSIVYEGLDEKLKRPVAIKVLHPFLASGQEYRSRFFREAQAVARLNHQNIVQIFDVASIDAATEQLYIVTELLDGETLTDFSKRVNFKEYPELCAMIIWQVAQALLHAHQRGIIHRDIKPENIMICRDGQIKLMDFGIASLGSEDSITQSGTLLGSLAHLAPEVIKGQKADVPSDIFSLTTVFFWMLTGELPFKGASPHALLKAIVDSSPKKVQSLSPFITDHIASVVEKGMKKDPEARFKSCSDLSEALRQALSAMGLSIDKHLQSVLKDPAQALSVFQTWLMKSVLQQKEIYHQQNNEAGALALECRLNASPPPKKISKKPLIILAVLMPVFAGAAIFGLKVLKASMPIMQVKEERTLEIEPIFEPETLDTPLMKEVIEKPVPAIIEEPKPVAQKTQEVEFIIWPFANVFLDGRAVAKNIKHGKIELKPGMHQLIFTHAYAATVEKIIHVNGTKIPLIKIELIKSKPAFLVVHSATDADVAVDKSFKGSTSKSTQKPIVIPMPDKTQSMIKEVIISQDGFKPYIVEVEFIAGQTKHINADLILKSDERAYR